MDAICTNDKIRINDVSVPVTSGFTPYNSHAPGGIVCVAVFFDVDHSGAILNCHELRVCFLAQCSEQRFDEVLSLDTQCVHARPQLPQQAASAVRNQLYRADGRSARTQSLASAEGIEVAEGQRRQVDGTADSLDSVTQLEDSDTGARCAA